MSAQLTVQPTKQPAACRQEVQPALQRKQLGKFEKIPFKYAGILPEFAEFCVGSQKCRIFNFVGIQIFRRVRNIVPGKKYFSADASPSHPIPTPTSPLIITSSQLTVLNT